MSSPNKSINYAESGSAPGAAVCQGVAKWGFAEHTALQSTKWGFAEHQSSSCFLFGVL